MPFSHLSLCQNCYEEQDENEVTFVKVLGEGQDNGQPKVGLSVAQSTRGRYSILT
jgi:hypothetical protein